MVMVKFTHSEKCAVFGMSQVKLMQCGKLVAPFGLVQMRECEIVEYVK